jgi:plasmid stability protein
VVGAIQVKNVSEDIHEAVRQRAAEEGMTVSEYVLDVLCRDLALPSRRRWLTMLDTREPVNHLDVVATLNEVRTERDRELHRD